MRHAGKALVLFLLVLIACLSIGCSEKSTGPNPPPSTELKYIWAKRFGDANPQEAYAIAADAAKNVIIAGHFKGGVDFGGGELPSAGNYDIFVAKFSADGTYLWSKRFGDADPQYAYGVAVDASGNVILTGYFYGTVDFGGGPLNTAGSEDIFVVKFDPNGNWIWSRSFGDPLGQYGRSVAVDASGNVIVTGFFFGSVDFGGGSLTATNSDIFVAKFNGSNGDHIWSKKFGTTMAQEAYGVAVDGSGNIVVTGFFSGNINFGDGTLTSTGGVDIFVAKLASVDGAHMWSQRFGDGSNQRAYSVAVNTSSGDVVITGYFLGTIDFGGGALTSAGNEDIFVAKFGPTGTYLWSKRFGDGDRQYAYCVAVDPSGNVLLTGFFYTSVDFGGGALTSAGSEDIFIARLSAAGVHLWSKRFGDPLGQYGYGVAADISGNAVFTGFFYGTVDFGGGALTAGNADIFVAKYGPQ